MVTRDEIRNLILNHLEAPLVANDLTPQTVPDDFDLLREGIIDSFGFVELIVVLQEKVGTEIDFEDLDPEDLTVVGPLCRYVESKSGASSLSDQAATT